MGDISLVAQVVVFRNTRAFDQLVKEVPVARATVLPQPDLRRQRVE